MIEYQDAWRRYRLLRAAVVAAFCLDIFVGLFVDAFYKGLLHENEPEVAEYILIAVGFYIVFAAGWRLRRFKCPRCGRDFSGEGHGFNTSTIRAMFLSRRCAYCGLLRYARGPTAELDLPQSSRSGSGP